MSVVKTDKLAVGYGKKVIIDGIDLTVVKGQVVCCLGPNGSGKTTLLRTIAGLLAPVKGTVYLKGKDLAGYDGTELARSMAVVLTERISPPLLTVFEMVMMGRYPYTDYANRLTPRDIDKVWEILALVNGTDLADKFFAELSDGEKQKVLLARALAQEPELLVLDEPTSFLDLRHRYEFMAIFTKLSKEKHTTIILSLHDIELALRCSDVVVLLRDNRVLAAGPPEQLLTEETIQNLYGIANARYNELLGVTELTNSNPSSVFIIGGNGSGTRLYRLLSKHNYGISSGIIHENDVDYQVGISLGVDLITERAFEMIRDATFGAAGTKILQAVQVVDAGFPIGPVNKRNIDLVKLALENGKSVITLRTYEESRFLFDEMAENMRYRGRISDVIAELIK